MAYPRSNVHLRDRGLESLIEHCQNQATTQTAPLTEPEFQIFQHLLSIQARCFHVLTQTCWLFATTAIRYEHLKRTLCAWLQHVTLSRADKQQKLVLNLRDRLFQIAGTGSEFKMSNANVSNLVITKPVNHGSCLARGTQPACHLVWPDPHKCRCTALSIVCSFEGMTKV